jgi:hypothetical protein
LIIPAVALETARKIDLRKSQNLPILTELGVGLIVGNVVAFLWRGAWGGFGGTNVRPLIIALVVFDPNRRDGRVATFRPIPQSVSGVGVRFSIGDKIRNLGRNLFASPGARGSFLYCCGVVIIFLSLFSRNWESDLSSETLWRSCGVGRGAGSAC